MIVVKRFRIGEVKKRGLEGWVRGKRVRMGEKEIEFPTLIKREKVFLKNKRDVVRKGYRGNHSTRGK